jgi:hypothetical protein
MTTIGTNVLTRLGLMDPGSGASASDLSYLLTICNEMLQGWSIERPLVYTIAPQSIPLTSGTGSYTIGTGGTVSVPAPNRIEQAFFIDSTGRRTALDIVPARVYRAHRDLSASAECPDELYCDYNFSSSLSTLYFWPVPTFTGTATSEIEYWQPLPSFPDLTTNIPLKDGYQDAIETNLAYKACLTAFGMGVDVATKEQISADAALTKQRIHNLNVENGLVPPTEQTGESARSLQQPQQPQGTQ